MILGQLVPPLDGGDDDVCPLEAEDVCRAGTPGTGLCLGRPLRALPPVPDR